MRAATFFFLAFVGVCSGFVVLPPATTTITPCASSHPTTALHAVDRRGFVVSGIAGIASTIFADPSFASDNDSKKVLVLGGTGMVGSEVVKVLQGLGFNVLATSTDGRDGTVALDFRQEPKDLAAQVEALAQGCTAVISTVGVIGTENDEMVNRGSGIAASAAKKAGVSRFSYISVAPEVREFGEGFDFLQSYMQGKAFSEASIQDEFGSSASYTLIEPTFIYGGDKFALNPPRVASGYGQLIETLLSSAPFRAATNIAPEGFIKIALEPPVSASSVAKAAVAGALGKSSVAVLDTYDKIIEASKLV
uniref:NAD(P)-binding domain-containing protein n=1 Tax=Amphora coffeiformis TaxID=265554 RepID=A0A7S3LFR6_9STRA|eukprot:scaffold5215_cov181-Amphora_coffeaeformis.AAC.2